MSLARGRTRTGPVLWALGIALILVLACLGAAGLVGSAPPHGALRVASGSVHDPVPLKAVELAEDHGDEASSKDKRDVELATARSASVAASVTARSASVAAIGGIRGTIRGIATGGSPGKSGFNSTTTSHDHADDASSEDKREGDGSESDEIATEDGDGTQSAGHGRESASDDKDFELANERSPGKSGFNSTATSHDHADNASSENKKEGDGNESAEVATEDGDGTQSAGDGKVSVGDGKEPAESWWDPPSFRTDWFPTVDYCPWFMERFASAHGLCDGHPRVFKFIYFSMVAAPWLWLLLVFILGGSSCPLFPLACSAVLGLICYHIQFFIFLLWALVFLCASVWWLLQLPWSLTKLLIIHPIVALFHGLCALVRTIFGVEFWSSKHLGAVTSGMPKYVYIPVATVIFLGPVCSISIAQGTAFGPLGLKMEILAASGDLASDILWCMHGSFWDIRLLVAAFVVTFAGCFAATVVLFARSIFGVLLPTLLFKPIDRLTTMGYCQVFTQDDVGASADKFLVNVFATVLLVFFIILNIVLSPLACVLIFFACSVLQGTKLMLLAGVRDNLIDLIECKNVFSTSCQQEDGKYTMAKGVDFHDLPEEEPRQPDLPEESPRRGGRMFGRFLPRRMATRGSAAVDRTAPTASASCSTGAGEPTASAPPEEEPTVSSIDAEAYNIGSITGSAPPEEEPTVSSIDAEAYNIGSITELVFEAVPSVCLNVLNMWLLHRDEIKPAGFASIASLAFSAYMSFRMGFRYFYYMVSKGVQKFGDVPLPDTAVANAAISPTAGKAGLAGAGAGGMAAKAILEDALAVA